MNKLAKQNSNLAIGTDSRLNKTDDKQFRLFLNSEILKLFIRNGQKAPEAKELILLRDDVYNQLNRIWPGIKAEWISKAFQNGIDGEFGDFANISYRLMISWIKEFQLTMKAEDFGIKEEPMNTKERASFVLDGLRKRNPELTKLDNKGKEALKRKLNKTKHSKYPNQ